MSNLTSVGVTAGQGSSGTGTVSTIDALLVDGALATLGNKADAKSAFTDTTSISAMQVLKEISFVTQALAAALSTLTNTGNALDINVKTGVNSNGRAVPANSAPVTLASMTGQEIAASQSATQLGSTGAVGDYLDGILVIPDTVGAGTCTIKWDGTNTYNFFVTGTLLSLVPFYVPFGFISGNSGGFKIATGANVHVIAVGNFT